MRRACDAVGLARATAHRQLRPRPLVRMPRPPSHRRIPDDERGQVLSVLDSAEFIDKAPREVYGALLSAGKYLCHWSTMYRILRERGPLRDRRNHCLPRKHAVPRLVATAPNQVWTWDITKLATCERGVFLNLYVVLDLYSRYVVAWMLAHRENSALAKQLFAEAVSRYDIEPGNLVVHQDRGAPMTAHGFAELLSELGVERSYSRPRVSNDNPFSESHFHTVKHQPDYPGRFSDMGHGRQWCGRFFPWYNDEHHHQGLALFTPADVFHGRVEDIAQRRQAAMDAAFAAHPQRFVNGPPRVPRPPARVLINPNDGDLTTVADVIAGKDLPVGRPQPAATTPTVISTPGTVISQLAT